MQPMINIDVPDLERACRFYAEALSLQVRRSLFDGTVVELAGAGLPIFLLEKPAGSIAAAAQPRNYARHWTPVHFDVAVDDLDAALARALAAGAVLEGDVDSAAWGRIARLADPFGHGFCLIEFSDVGYAAAEDPR
ncbi:VOC family protein [Tahibacter sp.]|uniref:VOC family protein n=1 Tax=Tahibacter sp. TaxID=2056211 RepID=UPI0028C4A6ED|nr:VOC family protein [Tahibacter sp.]